VLVAGFMTWPLEQSCSLNPKKDPIAWAIAAGYNRLTPLTGCLVLRSANFTEKKSEDSFSMLFFLQNNPRDILLYLYNRDVLSNINKRKL